MPTCGVEYSFIFMPDIFSSTTSSAQQVQCILKMSNFADADFKSEELEGSKC